jgi:pimeloyl-ACP methyl ester carboxylesterase
LPCDSKSFDAWASTAADDLQATIEFVARRPDADPDKVIAIGNLSGATAAVALSARNPHGLRAVIAVSGGLLAEAKCSMADILVNAYQEFGKKNHVPNLWLYANSDIVFPPDLSDRLHTAFLDAGGDVKFVLFNHEGDAGNGLFGGARRIWFAQMDAFLRAQQLPTWTRADLLDVARKMGIAGPAAQEELFSYLGENYFPAPGEKAWAISADPTPDGSLPPDGYGLGADTIDRARQSALATCQKQVPRCVVVMENNRWVEATP